MISPSLDLPYTLLVCGSPKGSSPELLIDLAENARFVLAVDSGADWLDAAGITPNLLVGDLDSIDTSILAHIQESDCRFVTVPAHKDFTDFDLSLVEFAKRQTSGRLEQLVITNMMGGRLDHELGALGSIANHLPDISGLTHPLIVEDDCIATVLAGEQSLELRSIAATGSTFSIVALGTAALVSITGAVWELDQVMLNTLSSHGVSNVMSQANARVTVHSGTVLVIAWR